MSLVTGHRTLISVICSSHGLSQKGMKEVSIAGFVYVKLKVSD